MALALGTEKMKPRLPPRRETPAPGGQPCRCRRGPCAGPASPAQPGSARPGGGSAAAAAGPRSRGQQRSTARRCRRRPCSVRRLRGSAEP